MCNINVKHMIIHYNVINIIISIRLEEYTVEVTVGSKLYELALWDTGGIY